MKAIALVTVLAAAPVEAEVFDYAACVRELDSVVADKNKAIAELFAHTKMVGPAIVKKDNSDPAFAMIDAMVYAGIGLSSSYDRYVGSLATLCESLRN